MYGGSNEGGEGEKDGRMYQGVVWTNNLSVVCGMEILTILGVRKCTGEPGECSIK